VFVGSADFLARFVFIDLSTKACASGSPGSPQLVALHDHFAVPVVLAGAQINLDAKLL
jgi:hypothetical protein